MIIITIFISNKVPRQVIVKRIWQSFLEKAEKYDNCIITLNIVYVVAFVLELKYEYLYNIGKNLFTMKNILR